MTLMMAMSAGSSALGSLFKGITGLFSANAENTLDKQNAQQHLKEAGVNAQEGLLQGDQVAAHGAVAAAANGGGLTGSALSVISNLSSQAMFNARAAAYRGRTQANADIYAGRVAKVQGLDNMISSVVGAGSSIAGGFMQSAQYNSMQSSLGKLRGLGADSAYDYAG
jgi:hypothetical protein